MRHLHQWHWISSAISLVGLLLFTLTGFTLNHASDIAAEPEIASQQVMLEPDLLASLEPFADGATAPLPEDIRDSLGETLGTNIPAAPAEWSDYDVYLAMPQAGGDAWLSIDRETGNLEYEHTDRGWIAYLNDLHKGRDTGTAWRWFIDLFALASVVFILTGFVLLTLHARNRPSTWPLTGLGLAIPLLLALIFVH